MSEFKQRFLTAALNAAMAAGEAILKAYGQPRVQRELKEDATPVTEADRAAHSAIMEILMPLGLPVLSEEGRQIEPGERKHWQSFWMVDPLDGTKEFLRKNGEFTVNIALIQGNQAVMGVVYAPLPDLMYYADIGCGAFRIEDLKTKWPDVSSQKDLDDMSQSLPLDAGGRSYRVVASRSHQNRHTRQYIRALRKKHPGLETVSRGSALKFCLVAEGTADIYPRFGPTWEWDTAAGQAVAEAAGCRVVLHDRESSLEYNKEILLNPWFIVKR